LREKSTDSILTTISRRPNNIGWGAAQRWRRAARMAITDAKLGANEIVGPRNSVVVGTTMGEAEILGGLQHEWIVHGLRPYAARLSLSTGPRFSLFMSRVRLARRAWSGATSGLCRGQLCDWVRRRPHTCGPSRRCRHRSGGGNSRASVQRVRAARRHGSRAMQPFDSQSTRASARRGSRDAVLESEAHAEETRLETDRRVRWLWSFM